MKTMCRKNSLSLFHYYKITSAVCHSKQGISKLPKNMVVPKLKVERSQVWPCDYDAWGRALWRYKVSFWKWYGLKSFLLCPARQTQLFGYIVNSSPFNTWDPLARCCMLSWWELPCNWFKAHHLCGSQWWISLSLIQFFISSLFLVWI